jgi:hypothetical protein
LEKFLTGLTPGSTLTYTRGAAGVATSLNGGAGGASILQSGTQTIATLTANGSPGTPAIDLNTMSTLMGGLGGTATGGDINRTGQSGGTAIPNIVSGSISSSLQGAGGQTMLASGVDGTNGASGNPGRTGGLIIAWYNDPIA